MSHSINKVILVGNIGQEPEIKQLASGAMIAKISIATEHKWRDKNTNELQSITEWHNISFFGKLAEIIQSYAHKGDMAYIEGRLETKKWTGNDGVEKKATQINGQQFQLLLSRNKPESNGNADNGEKSGNDVDF